MKQQLLQCVELLATLRTPLSGLAARIQHLTAPVLRLPHHSTCINASSSISGVSCQSSLALLGRDDTLEPVPLRLSAACAAALLAAVAAGL